jgi:hypothetical protein
METARAKATLAFWTISQSLRKPICVEEERWYAARLSILYGCTDGHLRQRAADALDWLARGEGRAA